MGRGARRDRDRHRVDRREGRARARPRLRHPIVYTRRISSPRSSASPAAPSCPVVYDSVGKRHVPASLDCLAARADGQLRQSSGPVEPFAPGLLAQKGSLFLTRPTLFTTSPTRAELEQRPRELFDIVAGQGEDRDQAALRRSPTPPKRTARSRRANHRLDDPDRLTPRPPSLLARAAAKAPRLFST
jgi:hypothetical protein